MILIRTNTNALNKMTITPTLTLPPRGLILVHTGHRGCDNSFLQCHVTRL